MFYYWTMKEIEQMIVANKLEIVRVWNENNNIVVEISNGIRLKIRNY